MPFDSQNVVPLSNVLLNNSSCISCHDVSRLDWCHQSQNFYTAPKGWILSLLACVNWPLNFDHQSWKLHLFRVRLIIVIHTFMAHLSVDLITHIRRLCFYKIIEPWYQFAMSTLLLLYTLEISTSLMILHNFSKNVFAQLPLLKLVDLSMKRNNILI